MASVTDGAGNPGTATQQLTINTVPPVVTLDGGPSVVTNNPTPRIAGTSDVAPGTVVRVTVASQSLTALVQSGGTWNVTPTALPDGINTVTAAVTDPAGNVSTVTQRLTIDTAAPAVTITGRPNALTRNATPVISGTANVAPGTIVTISIAGQTITALVQANGTWNATPTLVGKGRWRVVAAVTVDGQLQDHAWQAVAGGLRPQSLSQGDAHRAARETVVAKLRTTRRRAGLGWLTWNGRIGRKLAPRGTYKIMLRAVSPAGASVRDAATLHIT